MDCDGSRKFLDIPECALLNRPLTTSIGADGIWDDFCSPMPPADSNIGSSFPCTLNWDPVETSIGSVSGRELDVNVTLIESIHNCSTPEPQIPVLKKRDILSPLDAREIFMYIHAGIDERPGASVFVSQQYGISPKTVRDIWNR